MFDFFYKILITQFIQNILKLLKIKYIIKIYYIINHILVKLINNFDIFLIIQVIKVVLKKVKHQIFEDGWSTYKLSYLYSYFIFL
jgi:hypothetical protein